MKIAVRVRAGKRENKVEEKDGGFVVSVKWQGRTLIS